MRGGTAAALLALLAAPSPCAAATLSPWWDGVWRSVTDRAGNGAGGDSARWGPMLGAGPDEPFDEYLILMRSYGPTLDEDQAWSEPGGGFRLFGGSLDHPRFPTVAEVRAGAQPLDVRWVRERTLDAQRDLLSLSFAIGRARIRVEPQFHKPDLDVAVGWAGPVGPDVALDAEVGMLDAFSDFAHWLDERFDVSRDEEVDYQGLPLYGRLAAQLRLAESVRAEVFAGGILRHDVVVTRTEGGSFDAPQKGLMAGAAVDVEPRTGLTTGLRAGMVRLTHTVAESEARWGPHISWRRGPWAAQLLAEEVRRERDDRASAERALDARVSWGGQSAARPLGVSIGAIGVSLQDRRDALGLIRMVIRLSDGVTARFGANIDLDESEPTRYEGGGLTLTARWP